MVTIEQLRDLHRDARASALEPNISNEERLVRQNRVKLLGEEIVRTLYPPIRAMENRHKNAAKEEKSS